MGTIAYALRDEFAGTVLQRETEDDPGTEVPKFTGGVVSVGDGEGRDIDLALELEAGAGVIVIDDADQQAVNRLDEAPALKRVEVPADRQAITGGYADQPNEALRAELARRETGGGSRANHDELVGALEKYDAASAADRLPVGENRTVKNLLELELEAGEEG